MLCKGSLLFLLLLFLSPSLAALRCWETNLRMSLGVKTSSSLLSFSPPSFAGLWRRCKTYLQPSVCSNAFSSPHGRCDQVQILGVQGPAQSAPDQISHPEYTHTSARISHALSHSQTAVGGQWEAVASLFTGSPSTAPVQPSNYIVPLGTIQNC